MHPPAGAFAYIAINASPKIRSLGYLYMILPVGIGCLWFVTWAWIVNKYINLIVQKLFGEGNNKKEEIELSSNQIDNSNDKVKQTPVGPTEANCGNETKISVITTGDN